MADVERSGSEITISTIKSNDRNKKGGKKARKAMRKAARRGGDGVGNGFAAGFSGVDMTLEFIRSAGGIERAKAAIEKLEEIGKAL